MNDLNLISEINVPRSETTACKKVNSFFIINSNVIDLDQGTVY